MPAKAQVGASALMAPYILGQTTYFGAQFSESRQSMQLGPKDAADQLRAPERTILALKSRVLAENYGPGAALWNLASMIGALKVQSISGDPTWSALAEEYFNRITGSALSFDAAGRHALGMYQVMTTFRRLVDGDAFTAYTDSPSGHARVMGYEGLCVEQGRDKNPYRWADGIECDPITRFPLRYCFIGKDAKGAPTERVLEGRVVHHHVTNRTFSARRGVPAMAHALNNFQDIIETTAFQKQAMKIAAMIGLTPKADPNPGGPFANAGLGAPLQRESVYLPPTTSAAPTSPQTKVIYEEAMAGGLVGTRPFDVVHDDRPHPNGESFKQTLLREAAIGLNMPPQLLFFMDDPGGAYARIILDLASRTIADHHANHLAPFMRRTWAYVIALGIKSGDVPAPSKGDWLKIKLTPPRMPTADIGKMGRLYIELRRIGLQSHRAIYEELGMDYEDEIDQVGAEFRLFLDTEKKYNLPPGSLTNSLLPQGSTIQSLEADPEPAPAPLPAAA